MPRTEVTGPKSVSTPLVVAFARCAGQSAYGRLHLVAFGWTVSDGWGARTGAAGEPTEYKRPLSACGVSGARGSWQRCPSLAKSASVAVRVPCQAYRVRKCAAVRSYTWAAVDHWLRGRHFGWARSSFASTGTTCLPSRLCCARQAWHGVLTHTHAAAGARRARHHAGSAPLPPGRRCTANTMSVGAEGGCGTLAQLAPGGTGG